VDVYRYKIIHILLNYYRYRQTHRICLQIIDPTVRQRFLTDQDRETKRKESLEKTLHDIKTELTDELGQLGDSEWDMYADYCRRVLGSYGAPSYGA